MAGSSLPQQEERGVHSPQAVGVLVCHSVSEHMKWEEVVPCYTARRWCDHWVTWSLELSKHFYNTHNHLFNSYFPRTYSVWVRHLPGCQGISGVLYVTRLPSTNT